MSPSLTNEPTIVPEGEDDVQFQKWLKELDNAEELMDDLEAKTEKLDAKMDALLNSLNDMNNSRKELAAADNTNNETASKEQMGVLLYTCELLMPHHFYSESRRSAANVFDQLFMTKPPAHGWEHGYSV